MLKQKKVTVPRHLSKQMKHFFRQVCKDYELESHHKKLLKMACESYDRVEQARMVLKEQGLTITDRYGQLKSHPCCKVENDNKVIFARLLREIHLDVEQPETRIPRI